MVNLLLFTLFKIIAVFTSSFKNILVIKSTKLLASLLNGVTAVLAILLVKLIVNIDMFWACAIAFFTHSVGNYIAMALYETKVQHKDVTKDLNSNIMNIDEAIEHCCQVAIEHKCDRCGQDHAQLAAWLRELRELKK